MFYKAPQTLIRLGCFVFLSTLFVGTLNTEAMSINDCTFDSDCLLGEVCCYRGGPLPLPYTTSCKYPQYCPHGSRHTPHSNKSHPLKASKGHLPPKP
jgi:hypothetical protein